MIDLPSVVDNLGTPVYIYDLAEVRANQQRLRALLPKRAGLYYALSANTHPELLREIRAGGARCQVCSPGELDAALVAGWPAGEVLYTGPGLREADLDWALWLGVRDFVVDSPGALELVDRRAAEHRAVANCLLRTNTVTPLAAGADAGSVLAEPKRFGNRGNARIVGLYQTIGETGVDGEPDPLAGTVRLAGELMTALARHGVRIGRLTLGVARHTSLIGSREQLNGLLDSELTGPAGLMFEAGCHLVRTAGTLVASVLDVRQSAGGQVVVLESGANHVGGLLDGECRPAPPRLVSRPPGPATDFLETTVLGPLNIPQDVWVRSARLPRLRPGDRMAVSDVGAYAVTCGLVAFAGHRMPLEVVVDCDDPDAEVAHVSRVAMTRYPEADQGGG